RQETRTEKTNCTLTAVSGSAATSAPGRATVRGGMSRGVLIGLVVAGGVLLGAGAAMAVSAGGYSPQQQDCTEWANANNAGDPGSNVPNPEPGCHNFQVAVGSANGTRFA